ncbi:MAG: hypothetical protein ACR2LK_11020 [Solirubrobacteraceae bacterium]
MNRKLLVAVVAVAAVLALVIGVALGRNLISSEAAPVQPPSDVVLFRDVPSGTSILLPASWKVLPAPEGDSEVLLRAALNDSASLQIRSTPVNLGTEVTSAGIPVVRKRITDPLIAASDRAQLLRSPQSVELGGLPGVRYRYTYGSPENGGAHDHYFLFKDDMMIQIVFQAVPRQRLRELIPVFERIASTFDGDYDG